MKVDLMVLNYNGAGLLRSCLPSVVAASRASAHECRVVVVDNASRDESVPFLERAFPDVRIMRMGANRGFCSFNDAAAASDADIIVLLNNDVRTEDDFIDPLIETCRRHADAFLAGPKCLLFDGKTYDGTKSRWWIRHGMFASSSQYPGYEKDIDKEGYTMQSGVAGAFDRKKFLELGGYDDLYLPGIMEDADLCYRAWRRGYKGYYQPASVISHMSQATFKREVGAEKMMELAHRNTFLFMWKNIRDRRIMAAHILWLPVRIVYSMCFGKFAFVKGFLAALGKIGDALKQRRAQGRSVLSDREVLFMGSDTGHLFESKPERFMGSDTGRLFKSKPVCFMGSDTGHLFESKPVSDPIKPTIAAITLTHNEERNIERCLKTLRWCDERIVVDTFSTDRTLEIARPLATRIMQVKMSDFSTVRNIGINEAKADWVFIIDADEIVPPELALEIRQAMNDEAYDGYIFNRVNYLFGRLLRSWQPDHTPRLFRKGKGRYEGEVHERLIIDGKVGYMKNSFIHHSFDSPEEHSRKMNLYTTLELELENAAEPDVILLIKPFRRFWQIYFGKRAYLDGTLGLILAMNALYYEFVRLFKIWERRYVKKGWADFYRGVDIEKEIKEQAEVHRELLDSLCSDTGTRLLEVGSGAGSIAISLSKSGKGVTTVDNNASILASVKKNADKIAAPLNIVCGDAFALPFREGEFDTVFSQGFLEHFADADIRKLIREMLRVSSSGVIISMPGIHYRSRDYGDERLLSKGEWERILGEFNVTESKEYYRVRTKKNLMRRLPLMYYCRIEK